MFGRFCEDKLKLPSKIFEDDISNQCGDNRDEKISYRKDIVNGKKETLPLPICMRKFPHQQVGVKKEHNKAHFYDGAQNRGQFSRIFRIHLITISKKSSVRRSGRSLQTSRKTLLWSNCAQGRIRTCVARRRQIYSLMRLTAPPPAQITLSIVTRMPLIVKILKTLKVRMPACR